MPLTERRSFFKSLFALPIARNLSGTIGEQSSESDTKFQAWAYEQQYMAVKILRHINSVQNIFRWERGRYSDLLGMYDSKAVSDFFSRPEIEGTGIGNSFGRNLKFGEDEIVPGWSLRFGVRVDGLKYVATLNHTTSKQLQSFATDELGLILGGRALDTPEIDAVAKATEVLESSAPIKTRAATSGSTITNLLRSLAVGATDAPPPNCGCNPPYCCNCFMYVCCCPPAYCGYCCPAPNPGTCCINCGCSNCPWCCSGRCGAEC